jgi:N-acyl-D-amino-acid deacylase
VSGDIPIRGDRIAAIGKLDDGQAKRLIDAKGLAISAGFIDMLGQSEVALLIPDRIHGRDGCREVRHRCYRSSG